MDRTRAFRLRLFGVLGLGTVATGGAAACGGDATIEQGGSTATGGGSAGTMVGGGGASATGGSAAAKGGATNGSGGGGNDAGGTSGSSGGANDTGGTRGSGGGGNDTGGTSGSSGGNNAGTGGFISVRRPFLVGSSLRASRAIERTDWSSSLPPSSLDARTSELLAAAWLKDALEEHASVAAFARFTLLMLSVGAPADLVVLSQRASLDEIEHARAAFGLARRYGSRDLGPSAFAVSDSLASLTLAEIAALTVAEGCVGETLGALLAAEQLEHATDPEVVRMLRRLTEDEARHSELAWRFVAWALETGSDGVGRAVRRALEDTIEAIEREAIIDYGVDVSLWHAHGRLTCAEARAVSRRGIEQVIVPCMDALLDGVLRHSYPYAPSNSTSDGKADGDV